MKNLNEKLDKEIGIVWRLDNNQSPLKSTRADRMDIFIKQFILQDRQEVLELTLDIIETNMKEFIDFQYLYGTTNEGIAQAWDETEKAIKEGKLKLQETLSQIKTLINNLKK